MRGYGCVAAMIGFCCALGAEQLPIKVYSTADGFPENSAARIVQDPRGFLWFCTSEGLSRFDGYEFTNFGVSQGLPDSEISDLLVASNGERWVATRRGICRFDPTAQSPAARFKTFLPGDTRRAQYVAALAEDPRGGIWCNTLDGLYLLSKRADDQVVFERFDIGSQLSHPRSSDLLVDHAGSLWIANPAGLYRRLTDGRLEHYTTRHGLPSNEVNALLQDRKGRLWVGTSLGLCLLSDRPDPGSSAVARIFGRADGLPGTLVSSLLQASDETIWVGTANGLSELIEEDGKLARFMAYDDKSGLPHSDIGALVEDREGNLWVGTNGGGVAKLTRAGFVSYAGADGLRGLHINAILETRNGDLCVIVNPEHAPWIHFFDGRAFRSAEPNYPRGVTYYGWGWKQHVLQDGRGDWWVPSSAGVARFPENLAHALPKAIYNMKAGLPGNEPFRVFEDSHGDVWLGVIRPGHDVPLASWHRASGRIILHTEAMGTVSTFREDRAGNLWIGFLYGRLARYRNGRFSFFGKQDGFPGTGVSDLHVDRAGRLWVGTYRDGLFRVDNPQSERPAFKVLTIAQGLSGDSVKCITEDRLGRIYVGTTRGIDRLDPGSGRIRHYTTADGLAPGEPMVALCDRHGALWFGTVHGISRLIPQADRPPLPPPVFITRLQVSGADFPVSVLGDNQLHVQDLKAGDNHLQFSFVSLSFAPGEKLLYQYILEGADRNWSAPADQRSVHYAGLPAGAYRFRVRAISAAGLQSVEPATADFRIVPVLWRRWWFQSALVLVIALAAYGLHRFRLAQTVALERIRTHIATDLHDDIGSSLARIGVLSELALRQLDSKTSDVRGPLSRIAALSREVSESMSDIVWSVNPAKDRLHDLTQRIRRYAGEACAEAGIDFRFSALAPELDRELGPDIRRGIFLILKEAVSNTVRHSGGTQASIEFRAEGEGIAVQVRDNGRGFEMSSAAAGTGLRSMKRRAQEMRGELKVVSGEGQGVVIDLNVPLARRPSARM